MLNGETMAVPARNIRGIKTRHLLGADDYILEDFVDGMPNVEMAVGIGRAVMENKGGPALGCGPDFLIKAHLLPGFELVRLPVC